MNKKTLIILITGFTLVFISIFIVLSYSGYKLTNSVITGDKLGFQKNYKVVKFLIGKSKEINILPEFLDKKYIILFQNNMEIRPSGGFMGSYALIAFEKGVLKDWSVKDIYVPDGQLEGYVEPPVPLQQAFKTGDWRLRNANWDVNFEDAARDIRWFFEKGNESDFDGIIAINLGLIKEILKVTGPIKPTDYSESINPDNFYLIAQSYAEDKFFPGSIRKQSYLHSVSNALIDKITYGHIFTKYKVIKIIYQQLLDNQILIWMRDNNLNDFIKENNWSGSMGSYTHDYIYPVESNLGANKANFGVRRSVNENVNVGPDSTQTTLIFVWENPTIDNDEFKWGGDYVNYQRIYIPKNAIVINIKINGKDLTLQNVKEINLNQDIKNNYYYQENNDNNFKEIGFWVIVPKDQKIEAELKYELPNSIGNYHLIFKRQPGIYEIPFKLKVNNKPIIDTILTGDLKINIDPN